MASQYTSRYIGLVTLSLCKFSYATSSPHQSTLLWTHLPERDHLFVVFDDENGQHLEGAVVSRRVMKIIRGGSILEHVNLEELARQVHVDDERAQVQTIPDNRRSVIIIERKPLLALRYILPSGQTHRIQLNFSPESGFDTALRELKRFGLPIRESPAGNVPTRKKPEPELPPPRTNPVHLESFNYASSSRATRNSDYGWGAHGESQPAQQQQYLGPRAIGTDTISQQASVLGRPQALRQHIVDQYASIPPAELFPNTLFMGASQPRGRHNAFEHPIDRMTHARRSASITVPQSGYWHQADSPGVSQHISQNIPPTVNHNIYDRHDIHRPNTAPRDYYTDPTPEAPVRRALFSAFSEGPRPATAPGPISLDTLSQMLPPKRNLPFSKVDLAREKSAVSDKTRENTRSEGITTDLSASKIGITSTAVVPDSLAQSKKRRSDNSTGVTTKRPIKKQAKGSEAPNPPILATHLQRLTENEDAESQNETTEQPIAAQENPIPKIRQPSKRRPTSKAQSMPGKEISKVGRTAQAPDKEISKTAVKAPSQELNPPKSKRTATRKRPASNPVLATSTAAAAPISPTTAAITTTKSLPPLPPLDPEWTALCTTLFTSLANLPTNTTNFPSAPQSSTLAQALITPLDEKRVSKLDLAEYAQRPEEERKRALEQFLVQCIMDDDFATLCEDVEGAWRRVGLEGREA